MPEGSLRLTPSQQNVLAEFCSLARSVQYDINTAGHPSAERIGEKFIEILERFDFTPQNFDRLYDLLHRSGANA